MIMITDNDFIKKTSLSFTVIKDATITIVNHSTEAKANLPTFDYEEAVTSLGNFESAVNIYFLHCREIMGEERFYDNGTFIFDSLYSVLDKIEKIKVIDNDHSLERFESASLFIEIADEIIHAVIEMSKWYK